jgi:hypothetical protein
VSVSKAISVAWMGLYAILTVLQSDEVAAWTTDVALIAIGGAAGLVAHRAESKARFG